MHRSNRRISVTCMYFPSNITTKIRAFCYTVYMFTVRVLVKQQKNIFDFIHNGHYAIAEEILHFYICFQQIRLFFSLSLSHIDNKSPIRSNTQLMHFGPKYMKFLYFFIQLFTYIHIILSCFLHFPFFK